MLQISSQELLIREGDSEHLEEEVEDRFDVEAWEQVVEHAAMIKSLTIVLFIRFQPL